MIGYYILQSGIVISVIGLFVILYIDWSSHDNRN